MSERKPVDCTHIWVTIDNKYRSEPPPNWQPIWKCGRCKVLLRLVPAAPSPTPAGEAGEHDTLLSRTDDRMGT